MDQAGYNDHSPFCGTFDLLCPQVASSPRGVAVVLLGSGVCLALHSSRHRGHAAIIQCLQRMVKATHVFIKEKSLHGTYKF